MITNKVVDLARPCAVGESFRTSDDTGVFTVIKTFLLKEVYAFY